MKKYNIAVVPLDGIGRELHPMAVELLKRTQQIINGFELDFQWYEAGQEFASKTGRLVPDGFFENMCEADAMFNGSAGFFNEEKIKVQAEDSETVGRLPQYFRVKMGNKVGLRPIKLMKGVPTVLANRDEIDILLLREIAEGGYVSPGKVLCSDNVAYDTSVVTRATAENLAHYAFQAARKRNGRLMDGKKMVTFGGKPSASCILAFYSKIFREIALQYSDIEYQDLDIDMVCEQIIKGPDRFDVVVTENMCGDIVSDIGACISGGMGVMATADIGGITPHFRPNHGTFPTGVGKNRANPTATILTAALMLDTLGDQNNDDSMRAGANLIRTAVEINYAKGGARTKDLGGAAGTVEVVNSIADTLEKVKI